MPAPSAMNDHRLPSKLLTLSRRRVLKLGMISSAGLLLPPIAQMQAAKPRTKPPTWPKPTMHSYDNYGWLRGFNVVPSWGARIEQAWWEYDSQRFRKEIGLAGQVHANCIRLWIEFTAWMADPKKVTARFLDAVAAIDEAGMKTMPCLFNRWHNRDGWDYGGTYTEDLVRNWKPKLDYVRALVRPLAADARVLVWDLCNEPQAFNNTTPVNVKEIAWLTQVAATVRESGAKQPVTIGTMSGKNIEIYAPLCDVLCAHAYARTPAGLDGAIRSYAALRKAHGKPMLVNECIPGCLDDAKRAALARYYVKALSAVGLGWMGWSLREGKAISTRRDRIDGNGIDGQGFHAWFTKGGRLRLVVALLICFAGQAWAVQPNSMEMTAARKWTQEHFRGETAALPFSFTFNGKPSTGLLDRWSRTQSTRKLDEQRIRHTLKFTDTQSNVEVRCETIEYLDFPTVEWTLTFRNAGRADSPILENIHALDASWKRDQQSEFLLHHAVGSPANGSDYGPLETRLGPGAVKRISAAGGRPTNSDLSYFNLQWGTRGLIAVVGWPGQWAAEFARDAGNGIRLRAGQERTHFKLLPGEEVRSPLIVLQFWTGDRVRSQNLWRRWMMAHSMPRPGGKLPPPQFLASSGRAYQEMIGANEANQIMHIDRYLEERLKLDYWWMDAGWYIQQNGWPQVGTWEIDPKRFPHGFKPISDHAHSKGVKILLWFEPERVMPGTWLYKNHPEWLLRASPGQDDRLAGLCVWSSSGLGGSEPSVTCNPTPRVRSVANVRWEPGRLAFHPGPKGEYSAVRFAAPEAGEFAVQAEFLAIDQSTTTDVFILHHGKSVFDGRIRAAKQKKTTSFKGKLALAKGEMLDFVVGWGNGAYTCDSTGLEIRLIAPSGKTYNAAREFQPEQNPNGPWRYGYLASGPVPQSRTFQAYDGHHKLVQDGVRLLNLGNAAARQWLTDKIDKLLTEQGIDLYRQDFNMDPLAFWRAVDAPDRQGITEIKHVTGLLAFWDELRRRHPNMLIDSCASGGRRNDLETMRRAVPLWRSDYAYEPVGQQCMTYGISYWLPFHGTGTVASAAAPYYGSGWTRVEPYAFWSNATPSLVSGIDVRVKNLDYGMLRHLYHQWRQISVCYRGDYYPLTPYHRDNKSWIAWQFNLPEEGQGVVQAFRRADNTNTTIALRLRGLNPQTRYVLKRLNGAGDQQRIEVAGSQLLGRGVPVTIEDRPGAAVFTYERIPKRR